MRARDARPSRCTPRALRAGERGFVLVGVLMFGLVLTILGLSLFSLSGFEAQFFTNSQAGAQAFYAASGGLERARFVLSSTNQLHRVKDGLPMDGVVYAAAKQGPPPFATADSTGPVDWGSPNDVWIRVVAEVRGERRAVEARFQTGYARSIYRNLISSFDAVTIPPAVSGVGWWLPWPYLGRPRTYLTGEVWQNDPDTSWTVVPTTTGHPTYVDGQVPAPDAAGFIDQWRPSASGPPPVAIVGSYRRYALGTPGTTTFYYTPAIPGEFGLEVPATPPRVAFDVAGTVVWMLDGGMHSINRIEINGTAADRLIVVARPGSNPAFPGMGIYLEQSFTVSVETMPLFLVSDGEIAVVHRWGSFGNQDDAYRLSIFGGRVTLLGPMSNASPPTSATLDFRNLVPPIGAPDPVLDGLLQAGLLPNGTIAQGGQFALRTGTWREVTESDPN